MSTRMLLEGTDIRALLQQVREEYGPDAKIVHAERIRTGGVGGFFAKQRFEVAVEIEGDDPNAFLPSGATPAQPKAAAPAAAPSIGAPLSFEDAVAAVNAENRTAAAAPAAPAAPRDAIDLVLAAMPSVDEAPAALTQPSAPVTVAPVVPAQPSAPVTVAPVAPVAPSVPTYAGPAGPIEAALLGTSRIIDSELPIERAARAAADHGLTPVGPAATAAHQAAPSALPPAAVMSPPVTLSPAMAASAAAARLIQAAAARVDLAAAQAPQPVLAPAPIPEPVAAVLPEPVAEQLAPVVPLAVVPEPGPDPILVPARPGDVLVLVGDPAAAYDAAVGLAARCRIPASTVSVLTARDSIAGVPDDRLLHDLLEVRLRGAELAHARTAGIVVVDAPVDLVADPQGRAWVADAVSVVGAAAVWALVDATRRTEDLQRWLGCLPAPQALVVHGAALTSDPDAVLGLGLPVAAHDGLRSDRVADVPLTVRRTS